MPHIDEQEEHFEDMQEDDFEFEVKREIQNWSQQELKHKMNTKDTNNRFVNASDDEEGAWDVGDENAVGDHTSVPKPSVKTRTIKDLNSSTKSRGLLSPIRENEGLNDSHEFQIINSIHVPSQDQLLAKSYQTQKDWK